LKGLKEIFGGGIIFYIFPGRKVLGIWVFRAYFSPKGLGDNFKGFWGNLRRGFKKALVGET